MLRILLLTFLLLHSYSSEASTRYINEYVPNAAKVGEGALSFYFWDVYNASLYAPDANFSKHQPFALRVEYLMNFSGNDIAEKSIEEIKKQGFKDYTKLKKWKEDLQKLFPNVEDGTVLTGILTEQRNALFYKNGKKIGEIADKELSARFFDIWLGEKTSAPHLRKQLMGSLNE